MRQARRDDPEVLTIDPERQFHWRSVVFRRRPDGWNILGVRQMLFRGISNENKGLWLDVTVTLCATDSALW
jgi:hypothetical protein